MLHPSRHRGFIILFGSRNIVTSEAEPPVQAQCPRCRQESTIVAKSYRTWFTLFFIPVIPLTGKRPLCECSNCRAAFQLPLDEFRRRVSGSGQQQMQAAIGLYNSLRQSPGNSITLNELMQMYAGMGEYGQAISAARDFPQALNSSEQCMSTLGRVMLAAGHINEAIQWFDAALARNPGLGEAQYHKAVACMSANPARIDEALAAARAARNTGYPRSDELLREVEARQRSV